MPEASSAPQTIDINAITITDSNGYRWPFRRQNCKILSFRQEMLTPQFGADKYTRIYSVTYLNSGGRQFTGRFRTSEHHGVEVLDG